MHGLKDKLRLIYLPFFIIAISFILLYTFFQLVISYQDRDR